MTKVCLVASISNGQYSFVFEKRSIQLFSQKSKINTRICGCKLDLTRLSGTPVTSFDYTKVLLQFLSCKNENLMLYESCTNIFLFQGYVNFNILTLRVFKCKLWKIAIDTGFALKKVFIDNQSQCKKLGIFFYFPFFPTDRPFNRSGCTLSFVWM